MSEEEVIRRIPRRKQFPGKTATAETTKVFVPDAIDEVALTDAGTPKARRKNGEVDKRGRKPKHRQLTQYNNALSLLDDNIISALQVVIDGLTDNDRYYRLKCAELLLKKSIPDKKQSEHTGPGGGPIRVRISRDDMAEAAADMDQMVMERIGLDRLQ